MAIALTINHLADLPNAIYYIVDSQIYVLCYIALTNVIL